MPTFNIIEVPEARDNAEEAEVIEKEKLSLPEPE